MQNVLSKYQTYSYHHILMACNSTEVVDELSKSIEFEDFIDRDINDKYRLRKTPVGEYIILINGFTDAELAIDDLSWTTIIAPGSQGLKHATSIAVEGELTILEPRSARFMSILQESFDKLQSDPNGVVFVLKTVFTGYPYDSNEEEVVMDVKPFSFVMWDMNANFSEVGSVYNWSIAGVSNGASKMPHHMMITDNVNSIGFDTNVLEGESGVIKKFEALVNRRYEQFYGKLGELLKDQLPPLEERGRKIKYTFDLDEYYSSEKYKVDDIKAQGLDIGEEGGTNGTMSFPTPCDVETALHQIMTSCSQVQKDSAGEVDGAKKTKIIPKILSTLNIHNTGKYEVNFSIVPHEMETVRSGNAAKYDAELEERKRNELLTYDYIFTGKNTEVLEFNMEMAMGMHFFQTLTTPANLSSSQNKKSTSSGALNASGSETQGYSFRKNTPIMMAQSVTDVAVIHSTRPKSRLTFNQELARHAAMETLGVKMKVVGNPVLLNEFISLPSETAKTPRYRTPSLVKLNIRMPKHDWKEGDPYSEPFWYDGYYSLVSIQNKFNAGTFTQELELYSLPEESTAPRGYDDANQAEFKTNEDVVED